MKRLERARVIRDHILGFPRDAWSWEQVGKHRQLALKQPQWTAMLTTAFNRIQPYPEVRTLREAIFLQQEPAALPNVLDLWVPLGGKVLSIEWDEQDLRLISFRRGDWEHDLFGLSALVE